MRMLCTVFRKPFIFDQHLHVSSTNDTAAFNYYFLLQCRWQQKSVKYVRNYDDGDKMCADN